MAWGQYIQRASRVAWAGACSIVLFDGLHVVIGSRLGLAEVVWATWLPVTGLGLCALAALLAAVTADRASRMTRLLLGLGLASYAPGTAVYTQIVAHQRAQAFPTLADFCWIGFYPLVAAAVVVIFRRSVPRHNPAVLADASIGALAALAMGSVLLLDFVLRGAAVDSDSIGSMVYSLSDQFLVGALVGTFAVFRWRPPRPLVILAVGLLLQAVEDAIYLHDVIRDSFPTDGWIIVFWLSNFTVISAAAVFPTLRAERSDKQHTRAAARAIIAFAIVLVLVATAIMLDPHPWKLSIALAAAGLLMVVGRMGLAVQSNLRLLGEAQDDSRTDPLTELGNRRDLHQMAERELRQIAERELEVVCDQPDRLTLAIYDLDGFKSYNDSYGHPAGDALLRRLSVRLKASVSEPARAFRLGGDEFCVLIPGRAGNAEAIASACHEALSESGNAFYVTNSYGVASVPQDARDLRELMTRADRRLYAMKMSRPLRGQAYSVAVLRRVLEETQPAVHSHQTEVCRLAVPTGEALGLSESDLIVLASAAEFHDVGKIAIPDSILNKPGPLDPDEWAYMQRHTLIGERFLSAVPGMEKVARIVRSSHERVDGLGYPDGLSGKAIPLAARIISACDAFDAMTSDRPYSRGRSSEAAMAELRRCADTQFDPRVVNALAHVISHRRPAELAAHAA